MLAVPSGSDWKADFGMCFAGLVASAPRPLKGGGQIQHLRMMNAKGSILPRSREILAKSAMEAEMSHMLFIDSDQTFPNWTLHRMLSHGKDIVAANCVTKVLPALPTARQFSEGNPAGELVDSRGKKGLEKVWRVGTGVMLIRMSVFTKLTPPWFPITYSEVTSDYTGEDWNFCAKAQEAGIDIYVDHELSAHIGHIGSFTFDTTHQENGNEQR